MKLLVKNFRGIEDAEIDLEGVAVLAALTGGGKTSFAQAVACALAGVRTPYPSLKKSDSGMMVRGGAATATAQAGDGDDFTRVSWPTAVVYTEGKPPRASVYAVGLESILDLSPKERALALGDLLHMSPTEDDLVAFLEAPDPERLFEGARSEIWPLITEQGWDAAYTYWTEHRAKTKGRWEDITGEKKYGKSKAAGYMPDGWTDDLAGFSAETLNQVVADAREQVEAHVGDVAVTASQREQWAELAATMDECTAAVEKRQAELADKAGEWSAKVEKRQASLEKAAQNGAEAKAELDALPRPPEMEHTTPCPWCDMEIVITGKELARPSEDVDAAQAEKMRVDLDAATEVVKTMRESYADIKTQVGAAIAALADAGLARDSKQGAEHVALLAAETASNALATAGEDNQDLEALDDARRALADAEARARAFQVKATADDLHADVQRSEHIIVALAPTGVRQRVLTAALKRFNGGISKVCGVAEWPMVSIDAKTLDITYGGRPYLMLSAGERYRTRAVLAATMALKDKSCALVFDNLGEQEQPWLDMDSLLGLIRIGCKVKLPTLITMTGDVPVTRAGTTGYAVKGGRLDVVA